MEHPVPNQTDHFLNHETFKGPFDPSNEQLIFDFLTTTLEENLSKFKPKDYYKDRANELEKRMNTIDEYHLMNIMRMQYEEVDILRGNLEYLKKSRDTNIKALY